MGETTRIPEDGRMTAAEYLQQRLESQRNWYSGKARSCKRAYQVTQLITVILAALVPVVTVVVSQEGAARWWWVATSLGLVVGLLASIEGVIHWREQWKNYRHTDQYLERETMYFRMRAGVYSSLDDTAALRELVERCETAISSENAATLNNMTTPLQPPSAGEMINGRSPVPPQDLRSLDGAAGGDGRLTAQPPVA